MTRKDFYNKLQSDVTKSKAKLSLIYMNLAKDSEDKTVSVHLSSNIKKLNTLSTKLSHLEGLLHSSKEIDEILKGCAFEFKLISKEVEEYLMSKPK